MIKVGKDREIIFDENVREKRQQVKDSILAGHPFTDYNINDYELVPFEFETGKRRVYKNFNFSIILDHCYCNYRCPFCVYELRQNNHNMIYDQEHIEDYDKYLTRLEEVLKMIRPLNPSISLTGGEPTLIPIFNDVLKMIDDLGFRKRCITTNGSQLLKKQNNGNTTLENLMKYHWNHLNISRASANDEINRRIMSPCDSNYCSMNTLKEVIQITNNSEYCKHRISCLLLKESVNSVDKMKEFVDSFVYIGANNFIFRELMDYDQTAKNTSIMNYSKENKIRLYDLWHDMENEKYREIFHPFLTIKGYYYYLELYKLYNDTVTVAGETADLKIQDMEKNKPGNKDVVYEMVFHSDGNLCGSWIHTEDILDKYKN